MLMPRHASCSSSSVRLSTFTEEEPSAFEPRSVRVREGLPGVGVQSQSENLILSSSWLWGLGATPGSTLVLFSEVGGGVPKPIAIGLGDRSSLKVRGNAFLPGPVANSSHEDDCKAL